MRTSGRPLVEEHSYKRNKYKSERSEYYREQDQLRSKRNYAKAKQWMYDLKRSIGCNLCEETEPCALDFHHIDPSTKSFTVASNHSRSRQSVIDEMNKCTLLCSNCHRKLHNDVITAELLPVQVIES